MNTLMDIHGLIQDLDENASFEFPSALHVFSCYTLYYLICCDFNWARDWGPPQTRFNASFNILRAPITF
jgi:hypothetical protein